MPIYEYKCEECGTVSEILVKNRAKESEVECPGCRSGNLSKLISVPGAMMTKGGSADLHAVPTCPNSDRCGVPSCPSYQH